MAFDRFNFVALDLTWLFQFNLLSILTPGYFTESVGYNLFLFHFIFILKSRGFLLGLKIISSVFETLNEILLALSQFVRFFRSIFKNLFNLFSDLLMIRRFVSPAKWYTLQCFIATCRSEIYSGKSKGPKTNPCGKPDVIHEVLDAKPLVDTNCLRFAKYDSSHLFVNPRIP